VVVDAEVTLPTKSELRNEFRKQAAGWEVPHIGVFRDIPEEIFPDVPNIFRAFSLVSKEKVRYVVLGQDPYYQIGLNNQPIATGVAFGVNDISHTPKNAATSIYKVLKGIYGGNKNRYEKSNLEDWARCKGILLLNAGLTVPKPNDNEEPRESAGRHLDKWEEFTRTILKSLLPKLVTIVAWGKAASNLVDEACPKRKNVWRCNHPSASRGELPAFSEFWKGEGKKLTCRQV